MRAAELLPDRVDVQMKAATVRWALNDFEGARKYAEAVLKLEPRNIDAQVLLGNALAGLKDPEGAIRELEEAMQVAPDDARPYTSLGAVQAAAGKRTEAEAAFKKALCNVCHVQGKPKTENNVYGQELAKLIEGSANDRMKAATAKGDAAKEAETKKLLAELEDQATVAIGRRSRGAEGAVAGEVRIAFTTDSFVVHPLFFPGGDIGHAPHVRDGGVVRGLGITALEGIDQQLAAGAGKGVVGWLHGEIPRRKRPERGGRQSITNALTSATTRDARRQWSEEGEI